MKKQNPKKEFFKLPPPYQKKREVEPCDPSGSYTGRPLPPLEAPEQDADDL